MGIYVGYVIQFLYNALYGFSPVLGGIVVGGLWGVCVIFGAHRALLPIGLNDVALTGYNTLMCFAGAANFSQAGAALGVMLKTKNINTRQVAASGALSAWLVGVTEPAIYGCNLRLKKPMTRNRAHAEQTSFGAWVSAAVALGLYGSAEEALKKAVTDPKVYVPDGARRPVYEKQREIMNGYYGKLFL